MTETSFDFSVLAPIGFAAIGAMLVLLLEVFLSPPEGQEERLHKGDGSARLDVTAEAAVRKDTRLGSLLAMVTSLTLILAVYAAVVMFLRGVHGVFNFSHPMLQLDPLSTFAIALIGVGALLSVWLSITYLSALDINYGEYYALLLLSVSGMFLLVSAVDLMTLYVGIELTNIPLCALVGFDRGKLRSNEARLRTTGTPWPQTPS